MIKDKLLEFSLAQAVTATAVSQNVIPLSAARDMGVGEELYVVTVVTTAMTDAGSDSTITVTLETDVLDAFGSPTVAQTLYTIPAVSAVGATFIARLQPFTTPEAHVRAKYTTANGDLTTGSFSTFIVANAQLWRANAKGYVIQS